MPGQGHETSPIPFTEASYSPVRIEAAINLLRLSENEIVKAAQIPPEIALNLLRGEERRAEGLGPITWPYMYLKQIEGLKEAGIIQEGFTANEKGSALLEHIASLRQEDQPSTYIGLDLPPFVWMAQKALSLYQKAGFIRPENYSVGIESGMKGEIADVSMQMLLAQYEGAARTLEWSLSHGKYGFFGDYAHGPDILSNSVIQVESGMIIPIHVDGQETGFAWQIAEPLGDRGMGMAYRAALVADPNGRIGKDKAHQILLPSDNNQTMIMVYKENGQRLIEGWGMVPGEHATDEDIRLGLAIRGTIHNTWDNMPNWDGKAILGIPLRAEAQNQWSATEIDMRQIQRSAAINILLRNRHDVEAVGQRGFLDFVGPGKLFGSVDELYITLLQSLGNGFLSRMDFINPPHVNVTTVQTQEELERFIAVVR